MRFGLADLPPPPLSNFTLLGIRCVAYRNFHRKLVIISRVLRRQIVIRWDVMRNDTIDNYDIH